jgi:ATP-dependent DNA ligase
MLPLETRKPLEIRDPIVEPLWSGTRLMAHVSAVGPRLRLIDRFGVDVAAETPALPELIADALATDDAIVDGIITSQATRGGVGVASIAQPRTSMTSLITRNDAGVEIRPPAADEVTPEAFVALDLLRVDGEDLLDLPLLERKRLLESVVVQGDRIRISVVCRPPVDAWVATWQGAGLRGAMLKGANSRYVPGGQTDEWRTVTRVAGRR